MNRPVSGARILSSPSFDTGPATTIPPPTADAGLVEFRGRLLRALRRVCPWLGNDAEDIVQTAMVRVLERLRATGGSLDVSYAYLYRTAYHEAIDQLRRRRRVVIEPFDPGQDVSSTRRTAHDDAVAREQVDAVRQCLSAMEPGRKRAVTLHLLGHSVTEISALLACRPKQADNLVFRGMKTLRACLKNRGVEW